MSASREVTIWCDRCSNWEYGPMGPHRSADKARRDLRRQGWVRRGNRDLCPRCVEETR